MGTPWREFVRTYGTCTYVRISHHGFGTRELTYVRTYVRTHVRTYVRTYVLSSGLYGFHLLGPQSRGGANIVAQIRDMGVHVSVKANMICKPQRLRLAGTTNSGPGTAPVNHVTCVLIKRCLGQALRMPSVRLSALSTDRMQPRDCYGPRSPSTVYMAAAAQMDLRFLDNAGRWHGRTNPP